MTGPARLIQSGNRGRGTAAARRDLRRRARTCAALEGEGRLPPAATAGRLRQLTATWAWAWAAWAWAWPRPCPCPVPGPLLRPHPFRVTHALALLRMRLAERLELSVQIRMVAFSTLERVLLLERHLPKLCGERAPSRPSAAELAIAAV